MEALEGMVSLVTGSSRGIGRAIALALASEGADVVVNYRAREDAAAGVVKEIEDMGRQAISVGADVGDPEESASLVAETLETFGRLDILINNAGVWRPSLLENVEPNVLERLIATNLKGAFFLSGAAVRFMKEARWGRIVNISSVIGVTGFPGDTMYSATKAALFGFTKSLAKELVRFNITVNAVVPGFIETDMNLETGEEVQAKILKKIPMRRWGRPGEVADLVLYLVEKGDYVTGQLFTIDGGYTI